MLAFVLMLIVWLFFTSPAWNNFYYGTILKKPVPVHTPQQRTAPAPEQPSPDQRIREAGSGSPEGQTPSAAGEDVRPAHPDGAAADTDLAVRLVEDTVYVETNRIIAAVSTKGARIISLKVKDYTYTAGPRKDEFIDLLPKGSAGGAQLTVNNESFDEQFFTVINCVDGDTVGTNENIADDTGTGIAGDGVTAAGNAGISASTPRYITVGSDGCDLILEAKSSDGRAVQKVFRFADDTYKIGYAVRGPGVAGRKILMGWAGGIEEPESGQDMPFGQIMDRRRAHYSDGRSVQHFEMTKKGSESAGGTYRWVAMSSKYFFLAMVAEQTADMDIRIEGRTAAGSNSKEQMIDYSVSYQYQYEAGVAGVNDWIYAGPNGIMELAQHELRFEKALFPVLSWARHILWAGVWFPPLAELVLWTLHFFYGLVMDYGVAIFLLTLLLKLITFPLTQSSARSMLRMKDMQPKLVKLREKYKGNPQKMNEEMMALYKAEGVSPFQMGCLPMLMQMPIFIALFIVLRKAIELRGARSFLLPWVGDLSLPEALFYLPFSIPIYGNNVALMPIIMAALMFFQQKQTITDPNQKAIVYIMPPLMLVMFNSFPAGVVFYWTLSSAFSLAQQKWLPPKPKTPAGAASAAGAAASAPHGSPAQTGTRHKAPVKRRSSRGGRSSGGKRSKR